MTNRWTEHLDALIDEAFPRMVAIRRHLHANPEISSHEIETTRFLLEMLQGDGFRVRMGPEGRGLIVDTDQPSHAPRIAIRADMDALRIQDEKDVAYASRVKGVMHACGHDAHTAMTSGALFGLRAAQRAGQLPWPVCWRGIFQPAEETNVGANEMIEAGALDGVDAIIALHVDSSRRVGRIGVRVGPLTAACDEMHVSIEGRGGHAARPHESLDPIASAAQLVSSIYLFVPRAVDSHDPVVVTIGQISGGDSPNVIPTEVRLSGTIRTLGEPVREVTKNHIRQLARGLQEAAGTRIDVSFESGPDSVCNDRELVGLIRKAAHDLVGSNGIDEIPRPSMGGEDFANYLSNIPGAMFRLGVTSPSVGGAPLHSPHFDIDERALSIGAKTLARTAVLWSDPERHAAREKA